MHCEVHKQTINVSFVQFLEIGISLEIDQQRPRIPLDSFFRCFCIKIVGEVELESNTIGWSGGAS